MLTSLTGDSTANAPHQALQLDLNASENTQAWVTSMHFLNSLAKLPRGDEQESL